MADRRSTARPESRDRSSSQQTQQARHRPRKSLGQHFLSDRRVLRRIVTAAHLQPDDVVVEVGAGLGVLTAQLAKRARTVIAVEIDEALCAHLHERFASAPNVQIVCGDILSVDPDALLSSASAELPYVVAGNLPYNIAAAVLRHFLEAPRPPQRLIVMLQREVAEAIVAAPGRLSLLALSVQFYGEPLLLFTVPASSFHPQPKVESAVLRIDVREAPAVPVDDRDAFFRFLRAGFSAPRKQLRNVLSHALGLDSATAAGRISAAGIDPAARAQALSLEQWGALYAAFSRESRDEL